MDRHLTDQTDEPIAETPEDVAILYSWANLHGAKYRDFSASRREYRAQVRHRAAEELRQAELSAQAEAETAAAESERKAREAERAARASERYESPVDRERALREAEEAVRHAAAERVEAARRAESAAIAEAAARREEREIAEAHASAQRQAARWHESEVRRRSLAGPQPVRIPSQGGDPYEMSQGGMVDGSLQTPNENLAYTQPERYRGESLRMDPNRTDFVRTDYARSEERRVFRQPEPEVRRPRGFKPDQPSGIRAAYRAGSADTSVRSRINSGNDLLRVTPQSPYAAPATSAPYTPPGGVSPIRPTLQQEFYPSVPQRPEPAPLSVADRFSDRAWQPVPEPSAPAWLSASIPSAQQAPARPISPLAPMAPIAPMASVASAPVVDSLQSSRERVASRWFALKGVFEPGMEPAAEPPARVKEVRTPVLAVFSLAGGVGKTSMVATLGRALSSLGERVLLADTTSHGLLPYYFGATELKPGVVRTFSPPSGSMDAPIHLVSYGVDQRVERAAQDALVDEIAYSAGGMQRLLVDFNSTSGWLMRKMSRMAETILVPVAPDMNSVISLQTVERYFDGIDDADGRMLRPFYVLNQFDASLPLHLDVREVLRRQLGDRLLPYVVRRSPAVSEALAEGMTVVDYQPEGSVAEDYLNIAKWIRSISAPATPGFRTTRWSER
jgi:cellulose synthase operon protein YhjQ